MYYRPFLLMMLLLAAAVASSQSQFGNRSGVQIMLDGKPYYNIGTNYWYDGYPGLEKDKKNGLERLRHELDFLKVKGITNLRVLTGVEDAGQINAVKRVQPALSKRSSFENRLPSKLAIIENIAEEKNKLSALAEAFYEKIPDAQWCTTALWNAISRYKISYLFLWSSAGMIPNGNMHYFVPGKDDISEQNFKDYYNLHGTVFQKENFKEKLYN